jgi:glycosyltransferase involved in cell wall biosynthesis
VTRLSVVIPAHDEAPIIERLLHGLLSAPESDDLEIIVVPNGCTDDTAERAAAVDPGIVISSIAQASKIAALREGDRVATTFPRAYVDADVMVNAQTLLALADALSRPGGPLVASPSLVVDTAGATWPVRQYFRVWELTEYRQYDHIGSGIYALASAGRARFAEWPDVTADDRFIQQLFLPSERLGLSGLTFTVQSPRTLRAQVRRRARIARGNRELPAQLEKASAPTRSRYLALASQVLARPSLWPAAVVYAVATTASRLQARWESTAHRQVNWHRDDTTRTSHGR